MDKKREIKNRLEKLRLSRSFEAVFAVLVAISMVALVGEFVIETSPEVSSQLARINVLIAWAFLTDFCIGLFVARDKKQYWKTDWWMLLASIPFDDEIFSTMRIFRLIRVFRIWGIVTRPATIKHLRQQKAEYQDED